VLGLQVDEVQSGYGPLIALYVLGQGVGLLKGFTSSLYLLARARILSTWSMMLGLPLPFVRKRETFWLLVNQKRVLGNFPARSGLASKVHSIAVSSLCEEDPWSLSRVNSATNSPSQMMPLWFWMHPKQLPIVCPEAGNSVSSSPGVPCCHQARWLQV
jgi:hypothetical protein